MNKRFLKYVHSPYDQNDDKEESMNQIIFEISDNFHQPSIATIAKKEPFHLLLFRLPHVSTYTSD